MFNKIKIVLCWVGVHDWTKELKFRWCRPFRRCSRCGLEIYSFRDGI